MRIKVYMGSNAIAYTITTINLVTTILISLLAAFIFKDTDGDIFVTIFEEFLFTVFLWQAIIVVALAFQNLVIQKEIMDFIRNHHFERIETVTEKTLSSFREMMNATFKLNPISFHVKIIASSIIFILLLFTCYACIPFSDHTKNFILFCACCLAAVFTYRYVNKSQAEDIRSLKKLMLNIVILLSTR